MSSPVPAPLGPVLAPGDVVPPHYRRCFGCGPNHDTGLHLHAVVADERTVEAVFDVGEEHQGARGLAHGGILSAVFDETLGCLMWLVGAPAVTGRLEVDFRAPVPVGTSLHVRAWVVSVEGRRIHGRAEGRLGSPDGVLAVEGAAVFVRVGLEHFAKHDPRPRDGDVA